MTQYGRGLAVAGLVSAVVAVYLVPPAVGQPGSSAFASHIPTPSVPAQRARVTPTIVPTATADDRRIGAIRMLYQAVRAGMQNGSLRTTTWVFDYCRPGEDTRRVLVTDPRGRARMYRYDTGSEDASLALEHYYDEAGRLRFVFIRAGAVNGSVLEHRIYFDERLRRIRELHTYVAGPGYSWPAVWPLEQLQVSDPARAFRAKPPCGDG